MSLGSSVTDVNSNSPNQNPGIGYNTPPDDNDGAHDKAKKDKAQANPKPMNPDNPTVASTDGSKKILDAIKQVDSGNISGFIKKAVDAMMQIRAIDNASGGGGGGGGSGGGSPAATTSAALGQGLINTAALLQTAEQLGLAAILNALNSIMPDLIPLLDDDSISMLDQAILAVITDTNVGVLAPLQVQNAQATANAISNVQALNNSSTAAQIVDATLTATAALSSPSLGVDPTSLAYAIINAAVGSQITQTLPLNGVNVSMTIIINSSYIQDQLNNIPSFTGTEQQTIATNEAANVTTALAGLITTNTLTATNFLGILQTTQQNIQNASLQNALGTNVSNILGSISQLISQFSGNIQDSESNHQPRGRLTTVTDALQNHSKILSLIKKKIDLSDIFQQIGSMAGQAQSQVSSMMGSISQAMSGSGISSALAASNIIPTTSTVQSTLQNILQSGQSPLTSLSPASLNSLVSSGNAMLNTLTQTQVQSMLSALPPSLVMSMMGSGLTMMSSLTTNEINTLLSTLPVNTVTQLLAGNPSIANFNSTSSNLAEDTSDIAAALASIIATQASGVTLTAILPNGTTVICKVL